MHTEDLMTRAVHTCRSTDSLADAAYLMWRCDVGWLPVLSPEGQLVSVVTDRDLCMGSLFQDARMREARVQSVMSRRLVTCSPHDDVGEIESKMRSAQVRRLPVVSDDGYLLGVVTLSDIAHGLEREIDDAERTMHHPTHPEVRFAPEYAAGDALSGLTDAPMPGRGHALETVDTLAAITERRQPVRDACDATRGRGYADDDDVWMYE